MSELVLLSHYDNYIGGNENIIVKAWDQIKFATKLNILYDPSRCLTRDDFNLTGMIGCKYAFDTYKLNAGSKLTSWSIEISNQFMIRELNKYIPKYSLVSLSINLEDKENYFIDNLLYQISSNYEPSFISEEYYQLIISEVLVRLHKINRRTYEFFKFKINNLELTNATVGRKLNINSTTCLKYIGKIRTIILEVIEEL